MLFFCSTCVLSLTAAAAVGVVVVVGVAASLFYTRRTDPGERLLKREGFLKVDPALPPLVLLLQRQ